MEPDADAMMAEIMQAMQAHQQGDNRCTLAHYMADVVADPGAKLRWDERALAAADALTQQRAE